MLNHQEIINMPINFSFVQVLILQACQTTRVATDVDSNIGDDQQTGMVA